MAMDAAMTERLSEMLKSLFGDEKEYEEYEADPESYLAGKGLGEATGEDVAACMPKVAEEAGWKATADSSSAASASASGSAAASASASASAAASSAAGAIHHYSTQYVTPVTEVHNTYNETTTNIEDNDVYNDNSVETGDIYAGGDVTFDNDQVVASGDGAVAAGGDISGTVNTGDGGVAVGGDNYGQIQTGDGVQAGGDITDSTVVTGDVGGDVIAGNEDSVIGDYNSGIITGDDNDGSFAGSGNSGVVVGDDNNTGFGHGDVVTNEGSGDLVYGDGNVVDTYVEDGSAVSTGGDAYGHYEDSSIHDSYNTDVDVTDSFNATDSFNDHSVDVDVDVDLGGHDAPGGDEMVEVMP